MGFLHGHKLSLERDFQAIMKKGRVSMQYPLKFMYIAEPAETATFQLAVSVPKKRFHHAVDRNRMKRCVRESVRHCYPIISNCSLAIKIIIVYCDVKMISQSEIELIVSSFFQKIVAHAEAH